MNNFLGEQLLDDDLVDLNLLDDDLGLKNEAETLLEDDGLLTELDEVDDSEVKSVPDTEPDEPERVGFDLSNEFFDLSNEGESDISDAKTEPDYTVRSAANGNTFTILSLLPKVMTYKHHFDEYLVSKLVQQVPEVREFSHVKIPVLCVDEYGNEFLWLVSDRYVEQLQEKVGENVRAAWNKYRLVLQNRNGVEIITEHVDTNPRNVLMRYFPVEQRLTDFQHPVVQDAIG